MKSGPPRSGLLLAYVAACILAGIGVAYEAYRQASITLVLIGSGLLVLGLLLWLRSRLAIVANFVLGAYLTGLGIWIWSQTGRYGFLIGGICCLGSYWAYRDEIQPPEE